MTASGEGEFEDSVGLPVDIEIVTSDLARVVPARADDPLSLVVAVGWVSWLHVSMAF